jgi:TatD DNase family protein
MYIDSHSHLYLEAFNEDRDAMIRRAVDAGIRGIYLPNIDAGSVNPLFNLVQAYPDLCFPMMGLHPTSVKENFLEELTVVEGHLDDAGICAIGECGIDLYWDKSFLAQQLKAFRKQIGWARERNLPLVIHARDSFNEIFQTLDQEGTAGLSGVFHSFTGGREELARALSYGFYIGINGIVTFKNSGLADTVARIPPDRLLLETDAPFLAPHPHRGKRNESSYLPLVAHRVGEIFNLTGEEVGKITADNARTLFQKTS